MSRPPRSSTGGCSGSRYDRLADGVLRMGWGHGHHVLDLIPGEPGLAHFGFEVRDDEGLDGIAERLAAAGHAVETLDPFYMDDAISEPRGIRVVNPDGTPVHFHSPVWRQGEGVSDPGRRPIVPAHDDRHRRRAADG